MDLNQITYWESKSKGTVLIEDMNPKYARNAYAAMVRKAGHMADDLARYRGMRPGYLDDELMIAYFADDTARNFPSPQAWIQNKPLMQAVYARSQGLSFEEMFGYEDEVETTSEDEAYIASLVAMDAPVDEDEVFAQQATVAADTAAYAQAVTALAMEFEARMAALRAQFGVTASAGHLR